MKKRSSKVSVVLLIALLAAVMLLTSACGNGIFKSKIESALYPNNTPEQPAPAPVDPAPATPTPAEPTPVTPTPVEPAPVEPTPVEPTPAEPTPVEPTPVEPMPVEPTPVGPEPITEQEVNEFLNGFLCGTYHDDDVIFNHHKGEYTLDLMVLENLYEAMRARDSARYSQDIRAVDYSTVANALSFNEDAVRAVLDKLYGKDRVSFDQFFQGDYTLVSEGRIHIPVIGHGGWQMGLCRYKIRSMEQNGDEVNVTVSSIYVDSGYESDWDWAPRVFGPYTVLDLLSNSKQLASGNDSSLKEWSDYESFADRFSVEGTNAATVVITLFRDADGLHLK